MNPKNLLKIIFLFLLPFITKAQETTSEITGVITGMQSATLQGATVTAIHEPTGTKYVTTTRNDGRYNLANLKIGGPYSITVTYVGYKQAQQTEVNLLLGQEFKADFSLEHEAANLTDVVVTTTNQNRVFNNSHTGTQEIISRNQIERLPTVNRSLQDFTRLTPQANGLAFGGQSNQYNNVTVDGANFNNSFGLSGVLGGQTNSQPISLDAIDQIQVNLSPYDVRQGNFSGAGINTVTRSGTNTFRGTVYTYIKGQSLQGYKVGDVELPRQDFSYNLRGFSVGGPIIKNKLFFFVSGESERRTDPGTSFITSDATHQANGVSVSAANADILSDLADTLKNRFGYDPGVFQGYTYKTYSDKITAKIDFNINTNNSLTVKYNYLKSYKGQPASNSGSANPVYGRAPGQYAMPFYGSGYIINNNFNIVLAELNSRFSNKVSNKLQIGYTSLRDYRSVLSSTQSDGKTAGAYFPLVDILDGQGNPYTSFGYEQYTYGNLLNTDVFQLNDIFTTYAGAHEITIGTQNSFKKYKNGFSPAYEGVYRFNSVNDFYSAINDTSFKAARYDLSASLNPDGSFPYVGPKDQEYSLFVQDKWRIRNNFTLTYGVRADLAAFQNTFAYNPVVDTLSLFYNNTHINTAQKPKTSIQISPRLGFNWDVFNNQKTQVRGGAGWFSGPPPFVWISNQASNNGVLFGSISSGLGYAFSSDPEAYRSTITSPVSYSINATDPDFKFPQVFKGSLGIDQKIPGGFIVTLEGAYNKDVNAVYFQNVDLGPVDFNINEDGNGNGRPHFSTYHIYPVGGVASASNPNIGNAIYMKNTNKGYAYTLTFQVQKNFRNLYVNAAYTYQRSKDVLIGGSTASTMWGSKPVTGNPNSPELGLSNAYLPHRVIASAYYRVEYAKHFATSVGLLFEAAPSGVGSYVYLEPSSGSPTAIFNGDNATSNDLLYIPTTADLQRYVTNGQLETSSSTIVVTYSNGAASKDTVADTRTPQNIANQIDSYIDQDKYLSKHRGSYAERNAFVYEWFKRLDFNLTQDFYIKDKSNNRHTLRFTVDIVNAGNLIDKNWGTYKLPNVTSLIRFDKFAADGKTPVFSFPYQVGGSQTPYTKTFKDDVSIFSRWQMQIGFRYWFN